MPRQIVFDFDGTLISSHQYILRAAQTILSELKRTEITLEEVKNAYIPELSTFFGRFDLDWNDPEMRKVLLDRWAEVSGPDKMGYLLFEGIESLIKHLFDLGDELYIWTARDRTTTEAIMKSLNIEKYFIDIRCATDTLPKPDPAGLLELLGPKSEQRAVMIGDSVMDIWGAQAYGLPVLSVLWGDSVNLESIKSAGPDGLVKRPEDCAKAIEALIGPN